MKLFFYLLLCTNLLYSQQVQKLKMDIVTNQENFLVNTESGYIKQLINFDLGNETISRVTNRFFTDDQKSNLMMYTFISNGSIGSVALFDFRAIKEIQIKESNQMLLLGMKFNDDYYNQYFIVKNKRFVLDNESSAMWLLKSDVQANISMLKNMVKLGEELGVRIKLTFPKN